MPNCKVCGEGLTAGIVLHSDCFDKLIKKNEKLKFKLEDWKYNSLSQAEIIAKLVRENERLTTDVKEVVYCKDCKHRNTNECSMWIKCSECGSQWSWENNNDYCSYGERGDNGNE